MENKFFKRARTNNRRPLANSAVKPSASSAAVWVDITKVRVKRSHETYFIEDSRTGIVQIAKSGGFKAYNRNGEPIEVTTLEPICFYVTFRSRAWFVDDKFKISPTKTEGLVKVLISEPLNITENEI